MPTKVLVLDRKLVILKKQKASLLISKILHGLHIFVLLLVAAVTLFLALVAAAAAEIASRLALSSALVFWKGSFNFLADLTLPGLNTCFKGLLKENSTGSSKQ